MKNLFKNERFQLDEIVFQGRNKDYGAYVLRSESDWVLTKSMFIGIGFFALIAVAPFAFQGKTVVTQPDPDVIHGPHILDNVDRDDPKVVEPPKLVAPAVPVETFKAVVPTPKKEVVKETPAPPVSRYDEAVAGTQDIEGEKPTVAYQAPVIGPPVVTGPPTVPAPQPTVNPDAIIKNVDVEASFVGGINSFRNKVVGNFNTSSFDGSGETLKTTVTFVVERDGTISAVKATGADSEFNREAEKTIKNIKGKWIPAKVQGQPVRSYFRFPVAMMFE